MQAGKSGLQPEAPVFDLSGHLTARGEDPSGERLSAEPPSAPSFPDG